MVRVLNYLTDPLSRCSFMLLFRSHLKGAGSIVGKPVADVVVVHVPVFLLSCPVGKLLLKRFGNILSPLSDESSISEQV